jgi:hypothetical protein
MATLRQATQYRISQAADRIAAIKKEAAANGPGICPQHKEWGTYLAAKREASTLLTALHITKRLGIVKYEDAEWATKDAVSKLAAEGLLGPHCGRKRRARMALQALRLLKKLAKRTEKDAEFHARADAWASARAAAIEEARARRAADKAREVVAS